LTLIYPGSFDPVTLGHVDIAIRAAAIATRLVVAVLENPHKTPLFSTERRVALLQDALGHVSNIEIDSFSGLLAEYAQYKADGTTAIVRGLRTPGDFESEARYATYNVKLSGGIETIFIPASPSLSYIASSIVREAAFHIYSNKSDDVALRNMVSSKVQSALRARFSEGDI